MRLFIAIEIPAGIKQEIARVQERLKNSGVSAAWTRPEGIHLTLKFIGETAESRVQEIVSAMSDALKGTEPFRLDIAGAGTFPNPKWPRVVWIGVSGQTDRLSVVQSSIEDAMAALGFEREARVFTPHLTLGRIKQIHSRDLWLRALDDIKDVKLGPVDVECVSLMRSELRRTGAVYTEIERVVLE